MKKINLFLQTILIFMLIVSSCRTNNSPEPENVEKNVYNASVFFENLENGDTLQSPIHIKMGVEGMQVESAGAFKEGYGHHHIIVNCTHIKDKNIIPVDEKHIHFGNGQTETDLELEAGNYCLTLQFADGFHKSYGEELSNTIEIVVE